MAAKKKKKDHKKPKKVIEVTFETSRLTSGLDFRKAQIELYEKASIEDIEDAMNYHGILLHADQVVSDYKPVVDVDSLEEKYHELYKKELEALNQKRLVMDEDCIYFFITKVIEDNFDIDRLADPEYIVDHLNRYLEQENKYDYFMQILQNISHLPAYHEERNLARLFHLTGFDVDEMLVDIICQDLVRANLSLEQIKALIKQFLVLNDQFEFNRPVFIYTDLLEYIAKYGEAEANVYFEKGKELFPKKMIHLYNSMLVGLSNYAKEHEEVKDRMKELYLEAKQLDHSGINEREIYKLMKEHFDDLVK